MSATFTTENDSLRAALKHLRTALAGTTAAEQREWAGVLWYGLARLEKVLREQLTNLQDPEAAIDLSRPTLLRQQEKLRDHYRNSLEQCIALKWELYRAAQPYLAEGDRLGKEPPWKNDGAGLPTPDWANLTPRLHDFLDRLEEDREQEANLVLESATMDLGAGD